MAVVEPTVEQIRAYAKREGLRASTLASLSGLGKNTLRGIFRPDWNPQADTLHKVADALNKRAEAA